MTPIILIFVYKLSIEATFTTTNLSLNPPEVMASTNNNRYSSLVWVVTNQSLSPSFLVFLSSQSLCRSPMRLMWQYIANGPYEWGVCTVFPWKKSISKMKCVCSCLLGFKAYQFLDYCRPDCYSHKERFDYTLTIPAAKTNRAGNAGYLYYLNDKN